MDATNQKTTARLLVALMVGTVFLAAIPPTATATHLGPGQDVQVDVREARQSITIEGVGTFSDISVPTSPSGFQLRHSTAYNLLIIGIDTGASTGYGYLGSASRVELVNVSTGTASVLISTDVGTGPTATTRNATFLLASSTVPGPGVYQLRPQGSTNVIANILFWPLDDITVSVTSANPVTYSPSGSTVVTLKTTDGTGNIAAALSDCDVPQGSNTKTCLNFLPAPNATGTDGTFTFVSSLAQGAGNWRIYAFRNNTHADYYDAPNGDSIPERLSNTTYVVNPVTLNLATIQGTAFVGFDNGVAYRPSFPTTGNLPFRSAGSAFPNDVTVNRINITVASPTGLHVAYNQTMISTGTGDVTLTATNCWNTTINLATFGGTNTCAGNATKTPTVSINRDNGDIWVNTSDDIDGTNVWATGSYSIIVQLETAGGTIGGGTSGSMTPPEYIATATLTPAAPAAVNLQVTPTTVDVPAPTTVPSTSGTFSSAQGTTTLALTISGNAVFRHPLCDITTSGAACTTSWESDTEFRDNITLRGAVLPGWNITSYTASTGIAQIRLTPAANGTIFIDVNWKNTTTTIGVPVARGANLTLDVENITVDVTSTVTATVRDAFGNPVSNANVFVFPRQTLTSTSSTPLGQSAYQGTGATVVFGTGGPGAGQNGQYTFTLKPSQVADLVFAASVGSGSNINYSYAGLQVLPNADLAVTLSPTQTMAALRTQVTINVTNTSGANQLGSGLSQVFFLTETQRANLVNNGTTSLFTTGTIPTPVTLAGNSVSGAVANVTLNAGDYHVYVCSGTTTVSATCGNSIRDNRNNMPVFNVSAYTVTFNPSQIANNPDIQGATSVNIQVRDRDGNLSNGTITVRTNGTFVTGGAGISATLTNGETNLTLTGANAGIGVIEWNFNPKEATGSDDPATDRLLGGLEVVAGNLTFQPAKIPILQSTLVTARLTNFTGAGLAGRVIRFCGVSLNPNFPSVAPTTLSAADRTNCTATGTTESDGSTGVVLSPNALTPITVYVNDSNTGRTILVTAGTLVVTVNPTSPTAGSTVTVTVSQPGGTAGAGARVLVTKNGTTVLDATTNAEGQVSLPNVSEGTYTVTGIRSGFDNGTATFTVGAAPTTNASRFELRNLVLPSSVQVGTPVTVRVTVANTGNASGTANAVLLVNNIQRGSQSVTLDAGDNQTIEYEFNATVAGTYSVIVRIGDVTIGPQDITVGTPVVTPTTTPTPGVTPTVSPTTPPTATPTSTPPGTPAATPTTTPPATTPEPTVPGFEVVALLAALGVALLVLRRRS